MECISTGGGAVGSVQHTYRYARPSALEVGAAPRLTLETSGDANAPAPHFFDGHLREPHLVARLLTAVHLVVGSRFHTPANSLERAIALADPVVTCGGGLLRFEGFSSCCSVYIRVDLLPGAYDGEVAGKGTTNVDFNAPMRAALARIRDGVDLQLAVGREALSLRSGGAEVIERKVALPTRWLRGMVEVQSCQAAMRPCFSASPVEAQRFLRALPRASTSRTPLWISRGPGGLTTSTRPSEHGVRLSAVSRLRALEPLLPRARSLQVFADPKQQATAWWLDFGATRVSLVVSSEVWRGFSGEGQALAALMHSTSGRNPVLSRVRAALDWQAEIDPAAIAGDLGTDTGSVGDALRVLGASGLVGFDLDTQRYFHRVLPFDLSRIDALHPRLADARRLLDDGAVTLVSNVPFEASVSSGGVLHAVREMDGQLRCTCPWFARHQGERGPCKHVLAASALHSATH